MGSLGEKFEIFVLIKNLKKKWGLWVIEQNLKGSVGEEWAEKGGVKSFA